MIGQEGVTSWQGYRVSADGYDEASGSFGLTTTPVEVTVPLTLRASIGAP